MCVCVGVCVCVCLCLSHADFATASSFNFRSSQFHSRSELSLSHCLYRNTKKTDEVWIYVGITLRR